MSAAAVPDTNTIMTKLQEAIDMMTKNGAEKENIPDLASVPSKTTISSSSRVANVDPVTIKVSTNADVASTPESIDSPVTIASTTTSASYLDTPVVRNVVSTPSMMADNSFFDQDSVSQMVQQYKEELGEFKRNLHKDKLNIRSKQKKLERQRNSWKNSKAAVTDMELMLQDTTSSEEHRRVKDELNKKVKKLKVSNDT